MNRSEPLSAGFSDPVHQSQAAFRSALQALSRPGMAVSVGIPVPGVALQPALAHLLLTLTDDDTPVWWQQADVGAAQWLRFHTGAPLASQPGEAAFAVLIDASTLPELSRFNAGTANSPEFSTTLLIEVPALFGGPLTRWRGPGIRDAHDVRIAGLPDDFWTQWQVNQGQFPQGVDVIFCCADAALGLSRTTHVHTLEER
jgi:alpha-D-ribose 1-methylphosphonate 5-triphosphate synthase subunit PhnH